ncbi:MAG: hypothetical protein FJ109_13425, partial [Deltaproteobacteria bacterium]|nr:hypothetical protein [Deltaproteobacteria bacterium]
MRWMLCCLFLALPVSCGTDSGPDFVPPELTGGEDADDTSPPPGKDVKVEPEDARTPPPEFPEDFAVAFVYKGIIHGENDK